jgi:hypothetical protein
MTDQSTSVDREPFGDRLASAFIRLVRALLWIIFLVVIAGAIGVALYIGVPRVYQQYVIPVQQNTAAIDDLHARLDQERDALTERADRLQSRLEAQELQQDQDKQTIADLQAQLDELATIQEQHTSALARLDELRAELDITVEDLEDDQDQIDEVVSAIATQTGANRLEITTLNETLLAAEHPINTFRRELELLKAMELITRSRVFLAQGNEGLAVEDLQMARDLLSALQPDVLDYQQDELVAIIGRLDLAIANFAESPDLAENDIEVAWQLLVDGLPSSEEEAQAEEVSAMSEETEEAAPTETVTPEVTPTPGPTMTPTPTPSS